MGSDPKGEMGSDPNIIIDFYISRIHALCRRNQVLIHVFIFTVIKVSRYGFIFELATIGAAE